MHRSLSSLTIQLSSSVFCISAFNNTAQQLYCRNNYRSMSCLMWWLPSLSLTSITPSRSPHKKTNRLLSSEFGILRRSFLMCRAINLVWGQLPFCWSSGDCRLATGQGHRANRGSHQPQWRGKEGNPSLWVLSLLVTHCYTEARFLHASQKWKTHVVK